MRLSRLLWIASVLLTINLAADQVHQIKLSLPAKPAVEVGEDDRILIVPFVLAGQETDEKASTQLDIQVELTDFLSKTLQKHKFRVYVRRDLDIPTSNLEKLKGLKEFWEKVASQNSVQYIITGSADFRVEDLSHYETQEFVSKYNRKTYHRQVLVEHTGFSLEILIYVFNHTGKLIKEYPMKTFLEHDVRKYDELLGFFETIHPMEEEIVNLFSPHKSRQRRYIFGF